MLQIVENSDGKRLYQTPAGLFPSVNTILDATTPLKELKRLEKWRQREPNHEQIRLEAAARGTALHQLAAEFLGTIDLDVPIEPTEIDEQIEPFWRSLSQYLQGVSRTAVVNHALYGGSRQAIELPIYHPDLGYAGTLDWIGELQPLVLALADWKSSNSFKKAEYLFRYRLQADAYRMAAEALFGLEFDCTDIVVAIPNRSPQILHIPQEEMEKDNELWLIRLEQFKAQAGLVA
jgi:hypothetical protein